MSELDLARVMPGWQSEGILGTGAFGTEYLIRTKDENGAFSALKVIKAPPQREAIDNAVKLGIGRDLLTTYFGKFKNDLNWELTMYRTVKSPNLAGIEDMVFVDEDGPGWTGYIRTGIYTPLATYFDTAAPGQEEAVRMGSDIAAGLDALTQYGMVHGEVKPENVMVTDAGSFLLTDFGIRRTLEKAGSGLFGESPEDFEAPEVGADRKYSAASDIYSLGALMCYVANGCQMPQNRDPGLIKGIDPALRDIIKKAMSADPAQRHQNAAQLRIELAKLPLGKKSPRRAMAAAAAFDAVKRNGGAAMTATAATAAASAAAKTAKPQTAQPKETRAEPRTGEPAKPAQPQSTGAQKPGKVDISRAQANRERKKRSNTGIIVGIVAVLLCIAVAAAIWMPNMPWNRDVDDGPGNNQQDENTPGDGQNGGNNSGDTQNPGEGDVQNPGEGEDGNDTQTPGEGDTGDGDENPGGQNDAQNPGEEQNGGDNAGDGSGDAENPGGTQSGDDPGEQGDGQEPDDGQGNGGQTNTRPEAVNNDILFPSDTVRMTRADLEGKTREESYMLINEIYARHGYIFSTKGTGTNQTYFNSQKWYTPVTTDQAAVAKEFNAIETANIKTLVEYQTEMGWRGGSGNTGSSGNTGGGNTSGGNTTGGTSAEPQKENSTLFDSANKLITAQDLEGKTQREVTLILNEIFARHGYIFKTDYIKEYFEKQEWYKPVTSSSTVVTNQFNDTEQANVAFLDSYMRQKGWRK